MMKLRFKKYLELRELTDFRIKDAANPKLITANLEVNKKKWSLNRNW